MPSLRLQLSDDAPTRLVVVVSRTDIAPGEPGDLQNFHDIAPGELLILPVHPRSLISVMDPERDHEQR